jgi:hypothetical protein
MIEQRVIVALPAPRRAIVAPPGAAKVKELSSRRGRRRRERSIEDEPSGADRQRGVSGSIGRLIQRRQGWVVFKASDWRAWLDLTRPEADLFRSRAPPFCRRTRRSGSYPKRYPTVAAQTK